MNTVNAGRHLLSSVFICVHLCFLFLLSVPAAEGHTPQMASGGVKIDGDGRVQVVVSLDVLAFAMDRPSVQADDAAMGALLDGPDLDRAMSEAKRKWERGVEFADGVKIETVTFPSAKEVRHAADENSPRLPVVMDVRTEARIEPGTKVFAVKFPRALGEMIVTVESPGAKPVVLALDAGEKSPEFPVEMTPQEKPAEPQDQSPFTVLAEFVKVGFKHIVPEGLDHMLFVLGLFLLSPKLKPLLWQVTAFTLAHSITLGLSMYGVVRLSPSIVEPLIALSIAFVAIENLFTTKLHPWRPAIVFLFGLIHGLGFAGALNEMHLARGSFAPALVGFNVGVELGQLAVIAGAFLVVGWMRNKSFYRQVVTIPASLAIAAVGLFWTIQRIL